MAPEYCTRKFYDTQSDMFSLGMLIYALYNQGRTLYQCHDNYSLLMRIADDLQALNSETLLTLPAEVREHVKMLLSLKSELRPDAEQFSKVTVFIDNTKAPSVLFFFFTGWHRFAFSKMLVQKHWNTSIHYFKSIIFNVRCSTKVSRK